MNPLSQGLRSLVSGLLLISCQPTIQVEPIAKALTCGCPRVAVEGILTNRSENYFSNPKFVLKDSSGEVAVSSWLPLEVAPYHPDVYEEARRRGDSWPPETMAAYLDIPVRLYGRMELRESGESMLVVDHAVRVK